jgi:hypothetical protein
MNVNLPFFMLLLLAFAFLERVGGDCFFSFRVVACLIIDNWSKEIVLELEKWKMIYFFEI